MNDMKFDDDSLFRRVPDFNKRTYIGMGIIVVGILVLLLASFMLDGRSEIDHQALDDAAQATRYAIYYRGETATAAAQESLPITPTPDQ